MTWTYPDLMALPASLYAELVDWMNECPSKLNSAPIRRPSSSEVDKADVALGKFGKTSSTLQTQVRGFDSVLQQAGVNIGPAAKAIDEISAASGKTAGELGKLATAGLVVGTAMAAWEFGRAIAGFFKLDEAIGAATARLFGFGDVASEVAGAQQDTINRALAQGAPLGISFAEALAYNTTKLKERREVLKETAKADKAVAEAWTELTSIGGSYSATLAGMNPAHVTAIQQYLDMGVSQGVLATAYGYTTSQIKAVAGAMAEATAADKAWLESMKAAAAEAELYASILTNVLQKAITDTAAIDAKATAQLTAQTDARVTSILAEQAARDTIAAKYLPQVDKTTAAWNRMQTQLAALQKEKVGDIDITARQQVIYDEYLEAGMKVAQAADQMAAGHDRTAAATTRASQAAGVYMNQLHMLVTDPKLAAFFGPGPQGAVATTLYSGGQAGITPEMAAAMAAGQFINTAGVGAVHINISHPLGTPQAIAQAVGNALTPGIMQGRKLSGS